MPRLSPSASRSAWPSASAQSSTVWCSSTCEVAAAGELEREAAVARDLLEHVVEEADAGRDRDRGRAVEVDAHVDVGLLGAPLDTCAVRSRPTQPLDDRRPGCAVGTVGPHAQALDAEVGGELHVGLAIADHEAALPGRACARRGNP